jgi:hypothetical protein
MGLLEWCYGVGSLELEVGTPEARIFEMDIWKSRFPEWIPGRSVFQDGYLGPEYGPPEVWSPLEFSLVLSPRLGLEVSTLCTKRYAPLGSVFFF